MANIIDVSTTKWNKTLISNINATFNDLKLSIDRIPSLLSDKIDEMCARIVGDVQTAVEAATKAESMSCANRQLIDEMRSEINELRTLCTSMNKENISLRNDVIQQESYSRRSNLVLRGVPEHNGESGIDCAKAVRHIFKTSMNITNADNIIFTRCHRLHNGANGVAPKPIIIRFHDFNDRKSVWLGRFRLKGTSYVILEDFPARIEANRRILYPIFKTALNSDVHHDVYLNGDILSIGGRRYTVDNLDRLPKDLHPIGLSERSSDTVLLFGGVLSRFNPLSNWYASNFVYANKQYSSAEQAYMDSKARLFNDMTTSSEIMATKNPSIVKKLGSAVDGFVEARWNNVRENIMRDILKQKITQNQHIADKLRSTRGKQLAESGKNRFYGTGISLTGKDAMKINSWPGKNVLGTILMDIRRELN